MKKLIGLKIDGVRLLSAVEMEFSDKGLIQIKGPNKQGKTSILDSIELLFSGVKKRTEDMIQHGKDRADIIGITNDGYQIKRVLRNNTDTIEIRKDNRVWKDMPPQAFLNTLINNLTFNPRPFLDKNSKDKLKFMMELLKIDFTTINKKIQDYEGERLLLGREVKAFGEIEPVEPVQMISIQELLIKKADIEKRNKVKLDAANENLRKEQEAVDTFNNEQRAKDKAINDAKVLLESVVELGVRQQKSVTDLEEQLKKAKEDLLATTVRIENGTAHLKSLPISEPIKQSPTMSDTLDLESVADIDNEMATASENNVQALNYAEYLRKTDAKSKKEMDYSVVDGKINDLRDEKKTILAGTKMPLVGLEIKEMEDKADEYGLFNNGIHCENWSDSEGVTISLNLCLSMSPELRAVFIDRGEMYDNESRKALDEWAIENDIQAFITIVESIPEDNLEEGVFYVQEGVVIQG